MLKTLDKAIFMDEKIPNPNKKFKINDFISLKLEDGQTQIYLNNEKFIACKYLLLNIPLDRIEEFNEAFSIDEVSEKLNPELHGLSAQTKNISPETEFWGHCSNMQVWAENNYDSRLLHRNLAFPLLKKLVDLGDPIAKKVFKQEVAMRLSSGVFSVMNYLISGEFLKYLTDEELDSIKQENQNTTFWRNLGKSYRFNRKFGKAILALKRAIKLDEKNLQAWNELGICFFKLRNYPKSIIAFNRILRVNSDNHNVAVNLANAYLKEGKVQDSKKTIKKCLDTNPNDIDALNVLIEIYEQENNLSKSENIIKKTLKVMPKNERLHILLGEVLIKQNNFQDALKIFRSFYVKKRKVRLEDFLYQYEIHPSYDIIERNSFSEMRSKKSLALLYLMLCYVKKDDFGRAKYCYSQINRKLFKKVDIPNFSIDESENKSELIGDLYFCIAQVYTKILNEPKKSLFYYKKAIKFNPKYIDYFSHLDSKFRKLEGKIDFDKYDPYNFLCFDDYKAEREKKDYKHDYLAKDIKARRRDIQKIKEERKEKKK
jgi:tetratricopeptide (TPR) repeat protein